MPGFHYCCVRRGECIEGDLNMALSGLFGVFIMWHFILNEHGGGFFKIKQGYYFIHDVTNDF